MKSIAFADFWWRPSKSPKDSDWSSFANAIKYQQSLEYSFPHNKDKADWNHDDKFRYLATLVRNGDWKNKKGNDLKNIGHKWLWDAKKVKELHVQMFFNLALELVVAYEDQRMFIFHRELRKVNVKFPLIEDANGIPQVIAIDECLIRVVGANKDKIKPEIVHCGSCYKPFHYGFPNMRPFICNSCMWLFVSDGKLCDRIERLTIYAWKWDTMIQLKYKTAKHRLVMWKNTFEQRALFIRANIEEITKNTSKTKDTKLKLQKIGDTDKLDVTFDLQHFYA